MKEVPSGFGYIVTGQGVLWHALQSGDAPICVSAGAGAGVVQVREPRSRIERVIVHGAVASCNAAVGASAGFWMGFKTKTVAVAEDLVKDVDAVDTGWPM
ncbi:hypothetical protein VPNG_10273 [Cytospora leucostoma]|uniref:Uncharacterized protein n=1 Tax=Cytospora leucostoma TaxID=1230097 RepID=A0A423VBP3_9PEZI|nr:hypothetical protein VPNG_10273 [Cytospora leucostoma]